ncbi:hypothetical protein C8R43DRAFT_959985 [Mycena crocata]|nr:hypothetical protein C8R43DRAFT_959985 [Mycena crocata]
MKFDIPIILSVQLALAGVSLVSAYPVDPKLGEFRVSLPCTSRAYLDLTAKKSRCNSRSGCARGLFGNYPGEHIDEALQEKRYSQPIASIEPSMKYPAESKEDVSLRDCCEIKPFIKYPADSDDEISDATTPRLNLHRPSSSFGLEHALLPERRIFLPIRDSIESYRRVKAKLYIQKMAVEPIFIRNQSSMVGLHAVGLEREVLGPDGYSGGIPDSQNSETIILDEGYVKFKKKELEKITKHLNRSKKKSGSRLAKHNTGAALRSSTCVKLEFNLLA